MIDDSGVLVVGSAAWRMFCGEAEGLRRRKTMTEMEEIRSKRSVVQTNNRENI